jgi:hypothetical protein
MPQVSRPFADVLTGNWKPVPVYTEINELNADDSTLVTSSAVAGDSFEVSLSPLAMPEQFAPQNLSVRLRKTSPSPGRATITLLQGSAPVAYRIVVPTQTFTTYTFSLTTAEMNNITNLAALNLQVRSGFATAPGCATWAVVPVTWRTFLTGLTAGSCSDCYKLNIIWDIPYVGNCAWSQLSNPPVTNFCGNNNVYMTLGISGSAVQLNVVASGGTMATYAQMLAAWNPLASNTMTRGSINAYCTSWPGTLTLDPV